MKFCEIQLSDQPECEMCGVNYRRRPFFYEESGSGLVVCKSCLKHIDEWSLTKYTIYPFTGKCMKVGCEKDLKDASFIWCGRCMRKKECCHKNRVGKCEKCVEDKRFIECWRRSHVAREVALELEMDFDEVCNKAREMFDAGFPISKTPLINRDSYIPDKETIAEEVKKLRDKWSDENYVRKDDSAYRLFNLDGELVELKARLYRKNMKGLRLKDDIQNDY
jgi:hypothetical protein